MLPVVDGDRFLVCSDGLTGEVADEQIEAVLRSVRDPQEAVDQLVQAALRSGGRDNITVLIVDAFTAARPSDVAGIQAEVLPSEPPRGAVVGGSALDVPSSGHNQQG
jgi:protein phosphatase